MIYYTHQNIPLRVAFAGCASPEMGNKDEKEACLLQASTPFSALHSWDAERIIDPSLDEACRALLPGSEYVG